MTNQIMTYYIPNNPNIQKEITQNRDINTHHFAPSRKAIGIFINILL